jgi:hypothetical protein
MNPSGGGCAATVHIRRAAPGYGAAPPASRVLRIALRATGLRPALDPGASAAPPAQRHGQDQQPCPPERAALDPRSLQLKSLRFQGIAAPSGSRARATGRPAWSCSSTSW